MVCLSQRCFLGLGRVQMLSGVFEAVAMGSLCRSLQWALAAILGRALRAKELRAPTKLSFFACPSVLQAASSQRARLVDLTRRS